VTSAFDRAIAAIDAANAEDPTRLTVNGADRPKELVHAEMVTEWVRRLRPEASEALLLAARAHHIRRWTVPRASFPDGRAGYLRWRRHLHDVHADEAAPILATAGYDTATVERVADILHKRRLATDSEVKALEDALCLVFIQTQYGELADRLGPDKTADVVAKTLAKMTEQGQALAAELMS
jgi:hypothetical protein